MVGEPRQWQEQKSMDIKTATGKVCGHGVATGNNAAWLCCGEMLIGRAFSGEQIPETVSKQLIHCKKCTKWYRVCPKNGKYQGAVDYIQQVTIH